MTKGFMGRRKEESHVLFSPPYATYTIQGMQCDDGRVSAQSCPSQCAASDLLQDLASQWLQEDDLRDHPSVTSLQT